MKRAIFTLQLEMTDEYCEQQLIPLGKMLESGDFYKKLTDGIQDKLTVLDAKLEITTKTETNE